jgi:hypothetical protein
MGLSYSINKVNFEYVQNYCNFKNDKLLLINTLDYSKQECLIKGTIKASNEEEYMNKLLKTNKNKEIILYGLHHTDLSVIKKYNQLKKLGFKNVHIYFGGMYEWLLLQEVFGTINFEIDGSLKDIVEYKIE